MNFKKFSNESENEKLSFIKKNRILNVVNTNKENQFTEVTRNRTIKNIEQLGVQVQSKEDVDTPKAILNSRWKQYKESLPKELHGNSNFLFARIINYYLVHFRGKKEKYVNDKFNFPIPSTFTQFTNNNIPLEKEIEEKMFFEAVFNDFIEGGKEQLSCMFKDLGTVNDRTHPHLSQYWDILFYLDDIYKHFLDSKEKKRQLVSMATSLPNIHANLIWAAQNPVFGASEFRKKTIQKLKKNLKDRETYNMSINNFVIATNSLTELKSLISSGTVEAINSQVDIFLDNTNLDKISEDQRKVLFYMLLEFCTPEQHTTGNIIQFMFGDLALNDDYTHYLERSFNFSQKNCVHVAAKLASQFLDLIQKDICQNNTLIKLNVAQNVNYTVNIFEACTQMVELCFCPSFCPPSELAKRTKLNPELHDELKYHIETLFSEDGTVDDQLRFRLNIQH